MLSHVLALMLAAAPAPQKTAFSVDELLAMHRISEPTLSPDGAEVTFTVRDTDLAANKGRFDLYAVRLDGSDLRRLTTHPDADNQPRYSPDSKHIYFMSTRSGSSQVWRIARSGGEAEQVTRLPLDVQGFIPFSDGRRLLVLLEVLPKGQKISETSEFLAKDKPNQARIYDELLFRHWDTWEDGLRSHPFVWSPDQPDTAVDLLPGVDADVPTRPFGGVEELALTLDGSSLFFSMRSDGAASAWSTNVDIYQVSTDGKGKPKNLTATNPATETAPQLSPDGKYLAYLAMKRPKYESDRQRVVLMDLATQKTRVLTEDWDRSPHGYVWSRDGKTIYAHADHLGRGALFALDVASGAVRTLLAEGYSSMLAATKDGVLFGHDHLRGPVELHTLRADGTGLTAITAVNAARVASIDWGAPEQFSFKGARGDQVFGWLVRPPGLAKGKKVPVALLIHGGPQGSFGDHFHYRWNPQVFAGRGYATLMIDFHGSTGYGQNFTDAINGDWGGAPYEDLMKGIDAALSKYPELDATRVGALGASYGGFMINWINGQTDRFKALVCHDGNLDERMAYFDTEELWFPEWEHGGTPWENPSGYAKHNPIDHVKNWKTPTLVIHGGRDFRVVDTQGMSTFTALRRRGVPARFLYLPTENHWVLGPENSRIWHREVLGWLDKWVKGAR